MEVCNWNVQSVPLGPTHAEVAVALSADGSMHELQVHGAQEHACFLCNDMLVCDGRVHIATPLDPAIALLPLVEHNAQQRDGLFMQPEELLASNTCPWLAQHASVLLNALTRVCRQQDLYGCTLLKLDEAKVEHLLHHRVHETAHALSECSTVQSTDSTTHLKYAASLLAEYLPKRYQNLLYYNLGLDSADLGSATLVAATDANPPAQEERSCRSGQNKQQRTTQQEHHQQQQRARVQQQNAKAAKGTASISKFFKKK